MLLEAIEHFFTPCPRPWLEMGYLREQIAIAARYGRCREAWAPHLLACHEAIREGIARCTTRRRVLVLGAGLVYDLPLPELLGGFDEVYLADLVHRPRHRFQLREHRDQLRFVRFDISGVLLRLYREGAHLDEQSLLKLLREAEPGLPEELGGEPDLVISSNVCGQLMLLPMDWLGRKREVSDELARACEAEAAKTHLRWLSQRSGTRVLITETERLRRDRHGEVSSSYTVPGLEALRAPDRSWSWSLAPIPEYARDTHLEHSISAWIEGASGALV